MLQIQNTLTRQKDEFKPITQGQVKFYQCGPTVYSRQHIGNLRSALIGDLIRRSLEYLDFEVEFTRNITDVGHLVSDDDEGEDKMAKGAKREGLTPEEITEKYTKLYHIDLELLNVKAPTFETLATKYIKQMIEMVQELLDKGYAYATELAIYFEVDKFEEYTKLSGHKLEKNIDSAGHGDVIDKAKKKPYDFSIWFFKAGSHKNALQTWEHKFEGIEQSQTRGFPGWHIECSAMAKDTLGQTIDLHMGGREHIPVHHTNEIAQSEAANGTKFVNYWIHHEMLDIDGGKMAKSLGNVYSLDDIVEKGFDPLAYRYFLLQAHYRSRQNFTWEGLEASATAYARFKKQISQLKNSANGLVDKKFKNEFAQAIEDDFNTPKALALAWDLIKSDVSDQDKKATLEDFNKVLGLEIFEESKSESTDLELSPEIENLLKQRQQARDNKDFQLADQLRDKIKKEFGFEVLDTQEGQKLINRAVTSALAGK